VKVVRLILLAEENAPVMVGKLPQLITNLLNLLGTKLFNKNKEKEEF